MGRRSLLSEPEINAALSSLSGWKLDGNALAKSFTFPDFIDAWAFMCAVSLCAQAMDHHPDWRNVYNTVDIRLSTHDAGGVTGLDVELAGKIDSRSR
ncbi:MAG TPA: 4a-hydroxytetrahydrobiopterin dehydratase [Chthonomonadales bacterium]|nr:4a-hydroxytetrahydrobiopterin dehydratase [Chthonomonadales bacterium]